MRPRLNTTVAGLAPFVPFVGPAALERQSGHKIRLRLGANESSWGISPRAEHAMRESLGLASWYGDPDNYELREALAARHGVSFDNVLVGSGIDDLLGLIVRAFIEPGAPVVSSRGTYPTFLYHARGCGAAIHEVLYSGDTVDLRELANTAHRQRARIAYLANPDNPSGTYHDARAVSALLDTLQPDTLLLLDEAYSDFVPTESLLPFDAERPNIVRCRTFSKAHGLAGLRIGYAVSHPQVLAALDRIRLHFGVNRVAQAGALASLQDSAFVATVVKAVACGRRYYARIATEAGLRPVVSTANFVSIDVGGSEKATRLCAALLARGVFVRHCPHPLDQYIRVTVGRPEEQIAFGNIFREILSHL